MSTFPANLYGLFTTSFQNSAMDLGFARRSRSHPIDLGSLLATIAADQSLSTTSALQSRASQAQNQHEVTYDTMAVLLMRYTPRTDSIAGSFNRPIAATLTMGCKPS